MPKVSSRTHFEGALHSSLEEPPLSFALVDLDDFKRLNDEEGTQKGDAVLGIVTDRLSHDLPSGSSVTHLGGDAWAVALPGTTPEDALLLLEPIRRSLAPLRLSIGIVGFPDHTDDPTQLGVLADEALARAKRDRGNKTAIYVEEKMILKSNYYPRGQLERLSALAERLGRTEASILREALVEYLEKRRSAV